MRRLTIQAKLLLLLAAPLGALVLVGVLTIREEQERVAEAEHRLLRTALFLRVQDYVHEIQAERGLTGMARSAWATDGRHDQIRDERNHQFARSRAALLVVGHALDQLPPPLIDEEMTAHIQAARNATETLEALRADESSEGVTTRIGFERYNAVVAAWLIVADDAIETGLGDSLGDWLASTSALGRATERTARVRGSVLTLSDDGIASPALLQHVAEYSTEEALLLEEFLAHAPPQAQLEYQRVLASPYLEKATELRRQVMALSPGSPLPFSPQIWFDSLSAQINAQHHVGKTAGVIATREVGTARADATRVYWGVIGALALLVAMLLAGAWLLMRGISRSLNELARHALLISSGQIGSRIPEDANDALGKLARAFNQMQSYLAAMSLSASRVAGGDLDTLVVPRSDKDVLGNAVHAMTIALRDARDESLAQNEELANAVDLVKHANAELTTILEQLHESEARARHLAAHDSLTGLLSRGAFMAEVQTEIERASAANSTIAVLFIDLDRFKWINDSRGHAAGDQILRGVAERLRRVVRDGDAIGRLGGDEFTVLLRGNVLEGHAREISNRLLDELARPHEIDGELLHVFGSIGASFYPEDGGTAEKLIEAADVAMYSAKQVGGNTAAFHDPTLTDAITIHSDLEQNLWNAVQHNALELWYQPIVEVATEQIVGAEALVRWRAESGELVPASDIIKVAEKSGLITALGRWVLAESLRQIEAWDREGLPALHVAVNVSALEFVRDDLPGRVRSALAEHDLAPGRLMLEVTETGVSRFFEHVQPALVEIQQLGVACALDDFGTGESSLEYVSRLSLDELKIDRSLLTAAAANESDAPALEAALVLAQRLGLAVVAEGVEDPTQLAYLRTTGCQYFQGYLVSRPLPAADFARFIGEWTDSHVAAAA